MFLLIMFLIVALVLVFYIVFYSILFSNSIDDDTHESYFDVSSIDNYHYKKKDYINDFDSEFFSKLYPIADSLGVNVVPNVVLGDVVNRVEFGDSGELDTCISFGFFSDDFKNVLLLINLSSNDVIRSICKKSKIGYMEVKSTSATDLKHIKSRVSKAIKK